MLRTHNCGELTRTNLDESITLSGWVKNIRDKGNIIWIDLRDRYGITQCVLEDAKQNLPLHNIAQSLGREDVITINGIVSLRNAPNDKISTGEIEVLVSNIKILNKSKTPPFTIEENTDGGEELRMKYRYLDLRRPNMASNMILCHQVASYTREFLSQHSFLEIETPYLIKSTPEGARDFVVPSRLNPGCYYALPQSPQTFKQLLMIGGFDRYYQIVRCFRDEALRSDRQPEFSQIDCEMSFIEIEDIILIFEGLIKYIFKKILDIELGDFPRMTYREAFDKYGNDKPDTRFGMEFVNITTEAQIGKFKLFDEAESVIAINVSNGSSFSRKDIDKYSDFMKGLEYQGGLFYIKFNEDKSVKSSIDKFLSPEDLKNIGQKCNTSEGDLVFIVAGDDDKIKPFFSELRLLLADNLNLKDPSKFSPLWITDFPLLEWSDTEERYVAKHHPFTSPKEEDIQMLDTDPSKVKANAYDMVINGSEVGGGSIRIHDKKLQETILNHVGFTEKESYDQFGFLLEALEYGAPPHGGIAFGLARLCSILGGSTAIRDYIAFPKNNSGRDVMIDAPSEISDEQKKELGL